MIPEHRHRLDRDARHVRVDDEGTDTAAAAVAIGSGVDHTVAGAIRSTCPQLVAVDPIGVALADGGCPDSAGGIGATCRFAHGNERRPRLVNSGEHVALDLLQRPAIPGHWRFQAESTRAGPRDGVSVLGHLLRDHDALEDRETTTAILFRRLQTPESGAPRLFLQLGDCRVGDLPLTPRYAVLDDHDLLADELAHGVGKQLQLSG